MQLSAKYNFLGSIIELHLSDVDCICQFLVSKEQRCLLRTLTVAAVLPRQIVVKGKKFVKLVLKHTFEWYCDNIVSFVNV